jgi:hypothetical protein
MFAGYSLALLPCHLVASNEEVSSVPGERKQMYRISGKSLFNYEAKGRDN